jgi:hypothetical protein
MGGGLWRRGAGLEQSWFEGLVETWDLAVLDGVFWLLVVLNEQM